MKKLLVIIGLLFLSCDLVQATSYNVYTPQSYKQVSIVQSPKRGNINGKAIELLVDYSGSMTTWITLAIDTLQYILPKISSDTAVALRVFGDVSNSVAFSDNCKSTRLVAYFKKDNQFNIIKGLSDAKVGGMTPLEFALRETVRKDFLNLKVSDVTNKSNKKKIILVTDGYDTCGGNPCAYIRELMKSRNDIEIDVVQLGFDNGLMCLSEMTGGDYYRVGTKKQFENAFEQSFEVPIGTVEKGRAPKRPINNPKQRPQRPVIEHQEPVKQKVVEPKPTPSKPGYKFINF